MEEAVELCGFCRDILSEKEDVILTLPCRHEFCRDCLAQDQRINRQTTCPVCRLESSILIYYLSVTKFEHGKIELDQLSSSFSAQSDCSMQAMNCESEVRKKVEKKCFTCGAQAGTRCLECAQLVCESHETSHGCEETESNIATVKRLCPKHVQEEITHACKVCLKIFCIVCCDDTDRECWGRHGETAGDKRPHDICSLGASAELFREILSDELAKAHFSKDKLQDGVKKIYQALDSLETQGRNLIDWHSSQQKKVAEFLGKSRQAAKERISVIEKRENRIEELSTEAAKLTDETCEGKAVSYGCGTLKTAIEAVIDSDYADLILTDNDVMETVGDESRAEHKTLCEAVKDASHHMFFMCEVSWYKGRFTYRDDFDQNGLIYWLGSSGGTTDWVNPSTSGLVKVTSSDGEKLAYGDHSMVIGRSTQCCHTRNTWNSWFSIDLGVKLLPTAYTLRYSSGYDNSHGPRNWQLQGCEDASMKWTMIKQHRDDSSLNKIGSTHTWNLNEEKSAKAETQGWRHYRIYQTGPNGGSHSSLSVSGFEVYGRVTSIDECTGATRSRQKKLELCKINEDSD